MKVISSYPHMFLTSCLHQNGQNICTMMVNKIEIIGVFFTFSLYMTIQCSLLPITYYLEDAYIISNLIKELFILVFLINSIGTK